MSYLVPDKEYNCCCSCTEVECCCCGVGTCCTCYCCRKRKDLVKNNECNCCPKYCVCEIQVKDNHLYGEQYGFVYKNKSLCRSSQLFSQTL